VRKRAFVAGLIASAFVCTAPLSATPARFILNGVVPVSCSAAIESVSEGAAEVLVNLSESCNSDYRLEITVDRTDGTSLQVDFAGQTRTMTGDSVVFDRDPFDTGGVVRISAADPSQPLHLQRISVNTIIV
jgi:hypothetical protein